MNFQEEKTKLLIELIRFSGRDVNILDLFDCYMNTYQRWKLRTKTNIKKPELIQMYLRALRELKYLGFLQGTR